MRCKMLYNVSMVICEQFQDNDNENILFDHNIHIEITIYK